MKRFLKNFGVILKNATVVIPIIEGIIAQIKYINVALKEAKEKEKENEHVKK